MIIGLGTDIVEVERINDLLSKYGQRFLDEVFTPYEQEACLGAANQGQRTRLVKADAKPFLIENIGNY